MNNMIFVSILPLKIFWAGAASSGEPGSVDRHEPLKAWDYC